MMSTVCRSCFPVSLITYFILYQPQILQKEIATGLYYYPDIYPPVYIYLFILVGYL